MEFFKNRHTVRCYTDRAIDEHLLHEMIEAAAHAPNTGNMQWYSVVVTRDAEQKKRLAPAHFNQSSVTGASAVLTFCADLNRFEQWCRINHATPGFNNFQSFVATLIDTSIFAQQFCTIAEMNGLGTCYLGTTTYNAPQIASVLNLPTRVVPVITVIVGYPTAEAGATWRLPLDCIMHTETYCVKSDAEIAAAYKSLEEDPMSQKFVAENNKETLAQVFTDVRYPRESAEYFSKVYLDFMQDNAFVLPQE